MKEPKRLTIFLQPDIWDKEQRCSSCYGLNYTQLLSAAVWRDFTRNKRNTEIIEGFRPLDLEEEDV